MAENHTYFTIMGYFSEIGKWRYYGYSPEHDTEWTYDIRKSYLLDEECILPAYSKIVAMNVRPSVINSSPGPDKLKIAEVKISVNDSDIISEEDLKFERQRIALKKLTRQEIEDLDLTHIVVLHKLSQEEFEDNEICEEDEYDEIPF